MQHMEKTENKTSALIASVYKISKVTKSPGSADISYLGGGTHSWHTHLPHQQLSTSFNVHVKPALPPAKQPPSAVSICGRFGGMGNLLKLT